jgi:hypothetical protein
MATEARRRNWIAGWHGSSLDAFLSRVTAFALADLVSALLSMSLSAAPAHAADPSPLEIYSDGDAQLKGTFALQTAAFHEIHSWWGKAAENIGGNGNDWLELGLWPGLEGELGLGPGRGTLHGRVSGIFTLTTGGLDAAGSNFDPRAPSQITLEDAYLGWRSEDAFPQLGEDAIQLSFGSQPYELGSGFLLWDGSSDGGPRGGFWLAMRHAFKLAGIARLVTHGVTGELVFLRPYDAPNTSTYLYGTNWEFAFGEKGVLGTIGAGYWKIYRSQIARRDGMSVYDVRADVTPLAGGELLPGLRLAGELAYEHDPGQVNARAWYTECGYAFDAAPASPYVSYRFVYFSGAGSGSFERRFDPLFYGSSDWGTWYVGEILGNFVLSNGNLEIQTVRVRATPHEDVTLSLLYHHVKLDRIPNELVSRVETRAANVTSKPVAEEVDLVAEWEVNDWLSVTGVVGAAFPNAAAKQFTGGAATWVHLMLFSQIAF